MARKEFIGISSEYNQLRIAKICKTKSGIKLTAIDTIELPFPIAGSGDLSDESMEVSDELDDLFDTGGGTEAKSEFPGLESYDQGSTGGIGGSDLDDEFDMSNVEGETDVFTENELLLADYLKKTGDGTFRVGLHIPFGKTTYLFLKNQDLNELKKKERQELIIQKLHPIHNQDVEPDEYAWSSDPVKNTLLAYNSEDQALINLVELTETYFNGKLIIQERVPDENIWAGLASINYNLADDDITGLIAIGENNSRILFMKGERIINVLPIITKGESSEDILNTIFSKILFEIDKGELTKITRLLIVKSLKLTDKVKSYFQNQFENVEVDFLTLNPEIVSFSDENIESPAFLQPYLSALGAAWAASGVNSEELTNFSILPEYIREKQRALKLEWHGIILLMLIAVTPLFINYLYNSKAAELQEIEQEIQITKSEIAEYQPLAIMAEDMITEYALIKEENDQLLDLSQYSQKWSQVFEIFNNGFDNLSGVWLTTLRTNGDNINITGVALNREQIPNISALYSDGNINQVQEANILEAPVYAYSMQINNYKQDIEEFLLEIPTSNFDPENSSSLPFAFQDANGNSADLSSDASTEGTGSNADDEETDLTDIASEEQRTEAGESTNLAQPAVADESAYGFLEPEDEVLYGAYTIVIHSIPDGDRALLEKNILENENYKVVLWRDNVGAGQIWWRIGLGQFETVSDAFIATQELPERYKRDNFIIRVRKLGE